MPSAVVNDVHPHLQSYLTKLTLLFADVKRWIAGTGLVSHRIETTLSEEEFGTYTAPALVLKRNGKHVAELTPSGASVIGANGRIDLRGTLEAVPILDLNKGGPSVKTTIGGTGSKNTSSTSYIFLGIDEPGWYSIDRMSRKGRKLSPESLFDLLAEVSDYER